MCIREYPDSDIHLLNGRYGPYIKCAGKNYKLPKETEIESLDEKRCLEIINSTEPTKHSGKRFPKKTK